MRTTPLTNGHRVMASLVPYFERVDDYVAPFGTTQSGISQRVGLSAARISVALIECRKRGFVFNRRSHVKEYARPRTDTYWLTWMGLAYIQEVSAVTGIRMEDMYPLPLDAINQKVPREHPMKVRLEALDAKFAAVVP